MEQLTIDVMPRNVRDAAKAMRGGVRILDRASGRAFGIRTVKGFMFRFLYQSIEGNRLSGCCGGNYMMPD